MVYLMQNIKIMVVDDHAVIRDGIRALVGLHDDLEVIGEASNGEEAIDKAQELAPDVVIIDIALPGIDGIETIRRIKRNDPRRKVLVLTQYDDKEFVLSSVKARADGYLPKVAVSSELISAIRIVHGGESFLYPSAASALMSGYRQQAKMDSYEYLTEREREILILTTNGHSARQIADKLIISINTVRLHQHKIMEKLGIGNRADLIKYTIRKGLMSP
jgi:two-component system response regulator NreC